MFSVIFHIFNRNLTGTSEPDTYKMRNLGKSLCSWRDILPETS